MNNGRDEGIELVYNAEDDERFALPPGLAGSLLTVETILEVMNNHVMPQLQKHDDELDVIKEALLSSYRGPKDAPHGMLMQYVKREQNVWNTSLQFGLMAFTIFTMKYIGMPLCCNDSGCFKEIAFVSDLYRCLEHFRDRKEAWDGVVEHVVEPYSIGCGMKMNVSAAASLVGAAIASAVSYRLHLLASEPQ